MTDEFQEPLDRIEGTARDLSRLLKQIRSPGNANINVNAGGFGMQVAILACVVQFVVFVAVLFAGYFVIQQQDERIKELKADYNRHQDYLNAIYQQAPQLKPKAP